MTATIATPPAKVTEQCSTNLTLTAVPKSAKLSSFLCRPQVFFVRIDMFLRCKGAPRSVIGTHKVIAWLDMTRLRGKNGGVILWCSYQQFQSRTKARFPMSSLMPVRPVSGLKMLASLSHHCLIMSYHCCEYWSLWFIVSIVIDSLFFWSMFEHMFVSWFFFCNCHYIF